MLRSINTPVLLICFNRPDLTLQVLDQVRKVRPKKLYIALDGPRNKLDKEKIGKVKSVIKTIDWPCIVKTKFQKKNLGCKYGPVTAMNWLFNNEEMGIILEDDVLASISFFYFCDELLKRFKNNNKIGTICGNNFTNISSNKYSYMFSKYSQTWGWATWRRTWKKYDISICDWPQKNSSGWLNSIFNNISSTMYWKLIFNAVYSDEISSAWDYQWTYMNWKYSLLSVIPTTNLATNIGIGVADATHTKIRGQLYEYPKYEIEFPLAHPKIIEANKTLDAQIQKNTYVLWKEVLMNLIRKFRIIKKKIVG